MYYKDAAGIILVYDVTKRETFDALSNWIREIENNRTGTQDPEYAIMGNKCDDNENELVSFK